ncbi:TPA: NAD(P)H-binding protein, partial [Streptococcus pneumoniae]
MKLAVIAANGQAGKAIVEEAVKRGHEVTAIVRSENKSQAESI